MTERRTSTLVPFGLGLGLPIVGAAAACAQPECASIDYSVPECRVILENELARLRVSSAMTIRFVDPEQSLPWVADGLLESLSDRKIRARVAGPGPFRLLVERTPALEPFELVLDNVDPDAVIAVEAAATVVVEESRAGTRRVLELTPPDPAGASPLSQMVVSASRPCPERFRLAFTADIQTNPLQFQRIVERLQIEAEDAALAGEPLLGIIVAGDLTEDGGDGEYENTAAIMANAPVPVAVTAGNHDIFEPLFPYFNRTFGPGNYTRSICGVRLAVLDSGNGHIARSVQARLPDMFDERDATHVIAVMHHPPYAAHTGAGWSSEEQAQELLVEAALAGVDLIAAGHFHGLRYYDDIPIAGERVRELVVGTAGAFQGLGVPRYGYVRATFTGADLSMCFVEVPPAGYTSPPNKPIGLPRCP